MFIIESIVEFVRNYRTSTVNLEVVTDELINKPFFYDRLKDLPDDTKGDDSVILQRRSAFTCILENRECS